MTFETIQVCSEWQVRAGCLATGKLLQEPGAEQSLETVRGHESALSPATRGVSHQVMMMIVIMIISDHCGACTGCTERTGARWGQHTPYHTTPEISSLQLDLSSRKSNLNPRYHFIKEERYIKAYKSFVVSYGYLNQFTFNRSLIFWFILLIWLHEIPERGKKFTNFKSWILIWVSKAA